MDDQVESLVRENDSKMTAYIGSTHGVVVYQIAQEIGRTGKHLTSFDDVAAKFVSTQLISNRIAFLAGQGLDEA